MAANDETHRAILVEIQGVHRRLDNQMEFDKERRNATDKKFDRLIESGRERRTETDKKFERVTDALKHTDKRLGSLEGIAKFGQGMGWAVLRIGAWGAALIGGVWALWSTWLGKVYHG